MRVPNFLKGPDNLEQYPVVIDFVQRTRLVNIFSQMATEISLHLLALDLFRLFHSQDIFVISRSL